MIKLYTDAAVNQHSGHTAIGILIVKDGRQTQLKSKIASMNNHQAEFFAAIQGFLALKKMGTATDELIFYYTDSKIVVDSLTKSYAKHFEPQVTQLLALQQAYDTVVNQWIPDSQNHGAHFLALQALHAK